VSKALKIVGTIAGIAAMIPGPHQPIAAIVAVAANVGAAVTAKKPPSVQGSVNRAAIGANLPRPYIIGESYYGGSRRHWAGFGGRIKKIDNPYLLIVDVYSAGGPVEGLVARYLDYVPLAMAGNAATGYAAGKLFSYHQLGATPEAGALSTHWSGAPGWGPDYKLSSYAAISWCLQFDGDGKVFSAGIPATGAVWRGVKCYDPRLDSTYPGGSGPHRWADPADTVAFSAAKQTWTWTRCPGLNGLRYALGTWDRDETNAAASYLKTYGVGIPIDGIRVADFVALANVCDANGWHCDGVIFEPGNRDANLKDILAAGGAERCWIGGKLGLKLSAPRVPLDTITEADLATDDVEIGAMQGWEQRINTLTPEYRSRDHKWEYVPSAPIQIGTYLAEDGEEKGDTRRFNMVLDKHQAAQLAAYELMDARELGEIVLTCKPRLRRYGPGDLLVIDLPDDGLGGVPCVVLKRTFDPVQMTVEFVLRGETAAKHSFALAAQGTAPPTPALGGTAAYDAAASSAGADGSVEASLIQTSAPIEQGFITSTDIGGGTAKITIAAHTRRYADKDVAVAAGEITGLANSTFYDIGYDDAERAGGTVAYFATQTPPDARLSAAHPARHYVGYVTTAAAGGGSTGGGGATPPGGGYCVTADMLILMADGSWKRAGDLKPGDRVRTQHEHTLAWGEWRVSAVAIVRDQILRAAGYPDATAGHLFWTEEASWHPMSRIGEPAGWDDVVRITVPGAATYVARHPDAAEGVLSHNVKQEEQL